MEITPKLIDAIHDTEMHNNIIELYFVNAILDEYNTLYMEINFTVN